MYIDIDYLVAELHGLPDDGLKQVCDELGAGVAPVLILLAVSVLC